MDVVSYKSFALFAVIGFASIIYLYKTNNSRKLAKKIRRKPVHDAIMFSQIPQSEMITSQYSKSLIHPSMNRLLAYLDVTQHSLDICMYMITNSDIAYMMQRLRNRGVKIRFIVDADMAYVTGSATKKIEKYGIELRWMKSTRLMHNKFCIIDASHKVWDSMATPFVIVGSLNWTTQALKHNWENVLVTSKPAIVTELKYEFEKLWTQFKPIDSVK